MIRTAGGHIITSISPLASSPFIVFALVSSLYACICPSTVSHTPIFTSLAMSRERERMLWMKWSKAKKKGLPRFDSIRFDSLSCFLFFSPFYFNTITSSVTLTGSLICHTPLFDCRPFSQLAFEQCFLLWISWRRRKRSLDVLCFCCGVPTNKKDTIKFWRFLVFSIYQSTLVLCFCCGLPNKSERFNKML